MFRIDQCFARYPDFLANVELEAKVIATLQKAEDYIWILLSVRQNVNSP